MPRTLPWLTGGSNNGRIKKGPPTPRRTRVKSEAFSDDESDKKKTPTITDTPSKRDFMKSSKSPSSSPIRQPPPEEYLIEGFDKDDMYIMVEDEFYAVAQSFTQHLHHAEYVRQRKEAKLQNAAAIKDLARPTDGKTEMREETKRRKESEALSARQRSGVEQTKGKRPRVDSEDEEEDEELEVDKEDDPWVGTSLHGLMTSPRKTQSLVGLQGIKSRTRAAAGYSHTSGSVSTSGLLHSSPPGSRSEPKVQTIEDTASDDDDDLDIQPSRVTTVKRPLLQEVKTPSKAATSSPVTRKLFSREKISRPSPGLETKQVDSRHSKYNARSGSTFTSRMKMLFDEFDDAPEEGRLDISIQEPTSNSSSGPVTPQRHPQTDDAKTKKSRLNEVPTFLV